MAHCATNRWLLHNGFACGARKDTLDMSDAYKVWQAEYHEDIGSK